MPDRLQPTSVLLSEKKSRSKLDYFKDYVKNRQNSDSKIEAPHATYTPNLQYC